MPDLWPFRPERHGRSRHRRQSDPRGDTRLSVARAANQDRFSSECSSVFGQTDRSIVLPGIVIARMVSPTLGVPADMAVTRPAQ